MVHYVPRNGWMHYGQLLHGNATTTAAVRRAMQHSQESLRGLAKRYGVNQKTVAKWKQRSSAADRPTGPRQPHSTSLSAEEDAVIVAFRRHTLLALDDCLYALQPSLLHLTRSLAASMLAATRHLPVARARQRANRQEALQILSDRLLSHRHRRSPHGAGQALSARRHRPNPGSPSSNCTSASAGAPPPTSSTP